MRVAILIASIARGGMERQVIQLASGLTARGHDVLVIAEKKITDYHDEIAAGGVSAVELSQVRGWDPRLLSDVIMALRRHRTDVLICENFNATLWGRLAARGLGIPVVTAEHSTDRPRRAKIVLSNKILGLTTAAIVACADSQVDALVREGNPRHRIQVIHNGVDTSLFARCNESGIAFRESLGIPESAPVVGIVAAHRAEKRHDRFIRLVEILESKGVQAWGLAVGGGPLIERTRSLAAASTAGSRIVIPGPYTDISSVYSAMDASVLVSDTETFPLASLESQACEVPVVAMDVGGIRETLDAGVSGIVVGEADLEAMADVLENLLSDRARLNRMGAEARAWVSRSLSIDAMVSRFEMLLTECVVDR